MTTHEEKTERLLKQLMTMEGKAEIVNGAIVRLPFDSHIISFCRGVVQFSLHAHIETLARGQVGTSTLAFVVDLPHRKSFCADVSFYDLPPAGMRFPRGAPVFAVEFRRENDYGRAAELAISQKISDYFTAGTLVVWDVDLQSQNIIKSYRASDPQNPAIYRRGDVAEAEPAVLDWNLNVDDLFA